MGKWFSLSFETLAGKERVTERGGGSSREVLERGECMDWKLKWDRDCGKVIQSVLGILECGWEGGREVQQFKLQFSLSLSAGKEESKCTGGDDTVCMEEKPSCAKKCIFYTQQHSLCTQGTLITCLYTPLEVLTWTEKPSKPPPCYVSVTTLLESTKGSGNSPLVAYYLQPHCD